VQASRFALEEDADVLPDEVENFVTGVRRAIEPDRVAAAGLHRASVTLLLSNRCNSRRRIPPLQSHFQFVPAGAQRPQSRQEAVFNE
jgi:hypothetical protein